MEGFRADPVKMMLPEEDNRPSLLPLSAARWCRFGDGLATSSRSLGCRISLRLLELAGINAKESDHKSCRYEGSHGISNYFLTSFNDHNSEQQVGADLFAISGAQLSTQLTINDLGVFHEGLPPDFNKCFLATLSHDSVTCNRSPEVSSTAFHAQPPDLPPVAFDGCGLRDHLPARPAP